LAAGATDGKLFYGAGTLSRSNTVNEAVNASTHPEEVNTALLEFLAA
jgi:hypothetical protein